VEQGVVVLVLWNKGWLC